MDYFVQQLINGITLGSIYGLIAIGYTMVYGIIGMVNFAHGDVFMVVGLHRADRLSDPHHLARHLLDRAGAVHRAGRGDGVHLADQLGDRARRLPAVARLVSAGAADLGDRHVDLPVELRAGDARTAQQIDPADGARRVHAVRHQQFSGHAVVQAAHHLGRHRASCCWHSGIWYRGPGSAARNAPASRIRRWRRSLASTSTAPSR